VEFSEKKRNQDIVGAFQSYVEDRYLTLYLTRKLAEMLDLDLTAGKVLIIRGDSTIIGFLFDFLSYLCQLCFRVLFEGFPFIYGVK